MLRLSDLTLPLDHAPADLDRAVCDRLGLQPAELERLTVVRRGNDARRKNAIRLVYTLDLVLADEEAVLARQAGDAHLRRTPPIPAIASSRARLPIMPARVRW
ncbi:hypothetical protein ACFSTD_15865 [Novosphingobium colocasiae]